MGGTVAPQASATGVDQQLAQALAEIERGLAAPSENGAAALDVGQACRQYNQIRPRIESVLGLIGSVPFFPVARQIVGIVRSLMGVCDSVCAIDGRGFTAPVDGTKEEIYSALSRLDALTTNDDGAFTSDGSAFLGGLLNITWPDLDSRHRLRDGDVIRTRYTDIDPEMIEFVVELGPGVNWWKGLSVVNDAGVNLGEVGCQDSARRSYVLSFAFEDVEVGGKLLLHKAKFLGVHTAMYELADLGQARGKQVRLRWMAD